MKSGLPRQGKPTGGKTRIGRLRRRRYVDP
jgi:hypothetical protein